MDDMRYHVCDRDNRDAQYDGYGIFLCYTCRLCHKEKMAQFRPDIGERYDTDEPIEPDVSPGALPDYPDIGEED